MASDQKRWFKVWTSLLVDMDHLSDEAVGRWVRLGCRAALVGHDGTVTFSDRDHLARFLHVPPDAVERVAIELPNVHVSGCAHDANQRDGTITVTFRNWRKYQLDWSAPRMKRLRSKTRRDKKRKEVPPISPTERGVADAGLRPNPPSSDGRSLGENQEIPATAKPASKENQLARSSPGPLAAMLTRELEQTWARMGRAGAAEP
jgi:hypothetical protein